MTRKILHVDLDAFFCSVEENDDPSLRGKPFAVGGRPNERGVVASCSYAARMYGVHSAMPMSQALRICPDLLIISGKHADYGKISREIMDYFNSLTPLVEPVSIDEAFLDLSDLPDTGDILARAIQQYIWDYFNLPCSIGVASNKLVAKIATDFGKSSHRSNKPPQAITVIPSGKEAEFLAPLPTKALWGVGPKTSAKLAESGIHTIGDIARLSPTERHTQLGKFGDELARRALGIDESKIHTTHEIKSVSNESTFARDITDIQVLHETLHRLSESVGRRLRKKNLAGKTVKLKLRWGDFTTFTRQATLTNSTNDDMEIYNSVKVLFSETWQKGKPVRLLGVGVSHLAKSSSQLNFWNTTSEKDSKLLSAVDGLRERYGKHTILRAVDLKYRHKNKNH